MANASSVLRSSLASRLLGVASKGSEKVGMSASTGTDVSSKEQRRDRASDNVFRRPFLYGMRTSNLLRRTRQRIGWPSSSENSRSHCYDAWLELEIKYVLRIYVRRL